MPWKSFGICSCVSADDKGDARAAFAAESTPGFWDRAKNTGGCFGAVGKKGGRLFQIGETEECSKLQSGWFETKRPVCPRFPDWGSGLFPSKDGNASVLRNRDDRGAVGNPGTVGCAQILARYERVDRQVRNRVTAVFHRIREDTQLWPRSFRGARPRLAIPGLMNQFRIAKQS
jgi:hypothetical protein